MYFEDAVISLANETYHLLDNVRFAIDHLETIIEVFI